jgi:formylglycine-generating enzyme required for sulfatase activity
MKKKKKKSKIYKIGERALIIVSVIVITTVIVKATDDKVADNIEGGGSPCPADMVFVSGSFGGFCIDRYEASAGSACPYQDPSSQSQTKENIDYSACMPVSAPGNIPWRNISQNQAATACAKAGKRLPTNQEWQQAALATPDKLSDWGPDDCQVNKNWANQPGPAGSGRDCVSAAGAYDMIGNVWEWINGTTYEGEFEGRVLPQAGYIAAVDDKAMPSETNNNSPDENYNNDYFWIKSNGTRGVSRGGYWDNASDAGQYSVYAVSQPSFTGAGVGFRCAK